VLPDSVHGEVIGLAKDRTEETLTALLITELDARQRTAVDAVCLDRQGNGLFARERPTRQGMADTKAGLDRLLDEPDSDDELQEDDE
jgi:hypothetical protein